MQDLSNDYDMDLVGHASMAAGNTVSVVPSGGAPGTSSEQTADYPVGDPALEMPATQSHTKSVS